MDGIPSQPLLKSARAGFILVGMVLAVSLLCAFVVALPHNSYIRYQQAASDDFSRVQWVYERIHFDPTPIDVAIVGSSRIEAAISGPKLQRALSAQLGRPIHVANLAVPLEGRDAHYVIAQELLRVHPETRLVLISLVEPIRRSHVAFRNIAEVNTVIGSPIWINYYWLDNVAYLPYRNLSLATQSLLPSWFGRDARFNAARYAKYGTDFDTTENFRLASGKLVDRQRFAKLEDLEAAAAARGRPGPSTLARLTGGDDNIIENSMTAKLSQQLRARCAAMILVHLPTYRGDPTDVDIATNRRVAPILMTPSWIGDRWTDFSDAGHLRRSGIDKVTTWLPVAIKPYLGVLTPSQRCRGSGSEGKMLMDPAILPAGT